MNRYLRFINLVYLCVRWISPTLINILIVSPVPVSHSSFNVSTTTTTAHLKWEPLHRQQSILTFTLYNMHTHSVTGFYNISLSEIQSKFTMKNLQPGTRYMIEVMVATFLAHPGITLMQKLLIFLETGIVLSKNNKQCVSFFCQWADWLEASYCALMIMMIADQCPQGWLANGRSCYSVGTSVLSWGDAMSRCKQLVYGSHLVDLKTLEDLFFVSSYLQTTDNLLLIWTGLNDQKVTFHS